MQTISACLIRVALRLSKLRTSRFRLATPVSDVNLDNQAMPAAIRSGLVADEIRVQAGERGINFDPGEGDRFECGLC